MDSTLQINFIKGLMFGIEYDESPEGMFMVVADIGFIRFVYYRGPEELFTYEDE